MVSHFCHMSSVRSTSDCRGPVTRKRVLDREEQGKPGKDARRGRCHPLEAGFWPLWMTLLPRTNITEYRIPGPHKAACTRRTTPPSQHHALAPAHIKDGNRHSLGRFEWRGVAVPEQDPQPARGEEWVLPPQPRRTPRTPATRFTSQRADCAAATRGSVSSFSAKKDETDPLSEEQRQRKVQKGREALQRFHATKDAKDRGAPGRRPPLSRHLRRTR